MKGYSAFPKILILETHHQMWYIEHPLVFGSYLSAEMHSVYSIAPAEWATTTLGQSEPGSDSNEGVLLILQSSSSGALPSDGGLFITMFFSIWASSENDLEKFIILVKILVDMIPTHEVVIVSIDYLAEDIPINLEFPELLWGHFRIELGKFGCWSRLSGRWSL